MTDRAEGYVTDIGYLPSYFPELNPLRARLAFLNAGLGVPEISTACELGFGLGLSLNIHAAASAIQWYGTDINPAHVRFARGLAEASGAEVGLSDESFEEFARRRDLPTFDFIALHGVWSWISDRNRSLVVDFIRCRLKAGGVVYMSYNALPGWAPFSPVRHLLVEHASRVGAAGNGIAARIDEAVGFADRLLATEPEYVRKNPGILRRFHPMKSDDRRYLAHEYFNRDWSAMHFATVARWLEPAALRFACSATFSDHVAALSLSDRQRVLLGEIRDIAFRETVRDFMIGQDFRHDYWIKDGRTLSGLERDEALRRERVIAVTHRPDLPVKLRAALALNRSGPGEAVYAPILDMLVDGKAISIGDIERALMRQGTSLVQILATMMLLATSGSIAAAQDNAAITRARPHTDRLNACLIAETYGSGDIDDLASPVTGGGVHVERTEQIFLSALLRGLTQPEDWAREAAELMAGKKAAQGTGSDLAAQAQIFAERRLPTLQALQVV